MARRMKLTRPPKGTRDILVIELDPLRIARGHRAMKRGGVHRSAKNPSRAQQKRSWRTEDGVRRAG